MKTRRLLILDIIIIICLIWGTMQIPKYIHPKYSSVVKVDTVFVIDTIKDTVPKPVRVYISRYVKVPVTPAHQIQTDNFNARDRPDSMEETVTIDGSSHIIIPITQKEYSTSTYHAWVSGYMASLDSIIITQQNTVIHTEESIKNVIYKQKKWGLGIQAGCTYIDNKVQPYLGVGIHYNIFSW